MGYYTRCIEQLNAEYCHRTSITRFGRQATMLRLFTDSYEVRLRFERLLEQMQKGPTLTEDADFDYLAWAKADKWLKPEEGQQESVGATAATYGFSADSPFPQTFANHIKDAFGTRLKNINLERFNILMSSVAATSEVISDYEFDVAIDENIHQLQKTLVEIHCFKMNKQWSKADYARVYLDFRDIYEKSSWKDVEVKASHLQWLRDNVTDPDLDDYRQRRRELLLALFKTGFLDKLKDKVHVPAVDDLQFAMIKDDALISDLTDTLKWYAAFKKLCPMEDDAFRFNEYGTLGKYICDNNIPRELCWKFFHYESLIETVQQEMAWLEHPETKPQGEDEAIETFVERVKQIMLKAEDRNGETIPYEDKKHNQCTYRFQFNGRLFCEILEQIRAEHPRQILDYLDGATGDNAIGVTKVCPFIGNVVSLRLFNDEFVRNVEFEPAFQFVFGEKNERGQKRSFIQKMSMTNSIKDKTIFETIKTLFEKRQTAELLEENV